MQVNTDLLLMLGSFTAKVLCIIFCDACWLFIKVSRLQLRVAVSRKLKFNQLNFRLFKMAAFNPYIL